MSTPSERVHALVAAKKIAPEEGERLLAAIAAEDHTAPPERSNLGAILNPYDRFGGGIAAIVGVVVAAASAFSTRLGVRFDGFLDMHSTSSPLRTGAAFVEQLIVIAPPALLFWAFAFALTRRGRIVDFIGMVGLARLPLALAAPVLGILSPDVPIPDRTHPPALSWTIAVIVVVALTAVALNVTWLYQGFKNASGLRGGKLVFGFIGMVIAAEVVTKILLSFVL